MKKIKIGKREATEVFENIYAVGYCEVQYLTSTKNPVAYSSGVYGWSCDYYYFEDEKITISTGYSPVGKRLDYKLVQKYEDKARKIYYNTADYKETQKKLKSLLKRFLKEIKGANINK